MLILCILLSLLLQRFSAAIPLEDFYPFGASTTDSNLTQSDDGSSDLIQLLDIFPFFGTGHTTVFVSGCMTL